MEQINLNLENFEGPFDLLINLIRINKMDIMEINIAAITDQYMGVLRQMEDLNLDIASEFFVMAATLIEIKSRELLPKKKDEENEEQPKEMLIRKLKEYEYFKKRAEELEGIFDNEEVLVTRLPETIPDDGPSEIILPKGLNADKLFMLYIDLLDRQKEKINTVTNISRKIPHDAYRIEDKITELTEMLEEKNTIDFEDIIERSHGRSEAIVFFLAILELVRKNAALVYQEKEGSRLLIERRK